MFGQLVISRSQPTDFAYCFQQGLVEHDLLTVGAQLRPTAWNSAWSHFGLPPPSFWTEGPCAQNVPGRVMKIAFTQRCHAMPRVGVPYSPRFPRPLKLHHCLIPLGTLASVFPLGSNTVSLGLKGRSWTPRKCWPWLGRHLILVAPSANVQNAWLLLQVRTRA